MLAQILSMIAAEIRVTNLHHTNTTTFIQYFPFFHTTPAQIMRQAVRPDKESKDRKTPENYAQAKNNCGKEPELAHWLRLSAVFPQYMKSPVRWMPAFEPIYALKKGEVIG